MRNVFIINPFAGKGTRQKELIKKLQDGGYTYYLTGAAGEAVSIAKREAQKGDEVCIYACGGEGTNYEVLRGIVGCPNASLGLIPCGSANDFLKYFGDSAPFLDLDDQLCGTELPIDVIRVKSGDEVYYSLNSCSAGMDAMVCENAAKFKKWPFVSGSAAYVLGVVYTFFLPFGRKIDLVIDGKEHKSLPALFAVVANAPYYGGGYMSSPTANPADGKLNYSIICTRSRIRTVLMLGKYRKGTHIHLNYCRYGECREVVYRSDRPITFNIDGEIFKFKEVACRLLKDGVRLHLPRSVAKRFSSVLKPEKAPQKATV